MHIKSIRSFLLLLIFTLSYGWGAHTPLAQAAGADLRIESKDIHFSKTVLVSGDSVRIYARIYNIGTVDVIGYLTFFQGTTPIHEPQVISLVAGSDPEDVFVDFTVPESGFNIRAVVSGTQPTEIDNSNNVAITTMMTPVPDDDHDGISNSSDNCLTISNSDQLDTDHDGIGNVCDDDMDNDGLTNSVEAELGTNPLLKDTDGDGVNDPNDAYPLDPKRSVIEKKVVPIVVPPPNAHVQTNPVIAINTPKDATSVLKPPAVTAIAEPATTPSKTTSSQSTVSPNAVFKYEQTDWNTQVFSVLAPDDLGVNYEWNFGDGVKSSKPTVTHVYQQAGTYVVTLKTTDATGTVSQETTTTTIPFFRLTNPFIRYALGGLSVLLLAACASLFMLKPSKNRFPADVEEDSEEESVTRIHVKEE